MDLRLGSRRRAIAAAASAVLAAALALAIGARGCGSADETPEGAARAFVTAARTGDRAAVFALLGPGTRAYLESEAVRATEIAGGSRRVDPRELVSVTATGADTPAPKAFRVAERAGDRAIVEVVARDGTAHPLRLVRVDGHWRVELAE